MVRRLWQSTNGIPRGKRILFRLHVSPDQRHWKIRNSCKIEKAKYWTYPIPHALPIPTNNLNLILMYVIAHVLYLTRKRVGPKYFRRRRRSTSPREKLTRGRTPQFDFSKIPCSWLQVYRRIKHSAGVEIPRSIWQLNKEQDPVSRRASRYRCPTHPFLHGPHLCH